MRRGQPHRGIRNLAVLLQCNHKVRRSQVVHHARKWRAWRTGAQGSQSELQSATHLPALAGVHGADRCSIRSSCGPPATLQLVHNHCRWADFSALIAVKSLWAQRMIHRDCGCDHICSPCISMKNHWVINEAPSINRVIPVQYHGFIMAITRE